MKNKKIEASPVGISAEETFTDADGIQWSGFRVGNAFIGKEVADKRGITESMKERVRVETRETAALKKIYEERIAPKVAIAAIPPSERGSPFKWGTPKWYRNELALAQERIRSLEDECERLLGEKRERDPPLQRLIEKPKTIAKLPRPGRGKNKLKDRSAWVQRAKVALAEDPDLSVIAIADDIKNIEPKHTVRYIRKWVRAKEKDLRDKGKEVAANKMERLASLRKRPLTR